MLLLKMAFRNVIVHRLRTAVIGSIIVFGTVLAILGNSFVDAVATGMKKSVINSVTGHIQLYSATAPEKLAVFGNVGGEMPDIGHVSDFGKVRETLLAKVPNIDSMIPMGGNWAMVNPGNILDIKLEELRTLYKERKSERIPALKAHVHAIVDDIRTTLKANVEKTDFLKETPELKEAPQNLATALESGFWNTFDTHYNDRIEFLGNKIAPLIFDDSMLFLSYFGTVPEEFAKSFTQFEIVKGQMIPPGKRGFLFSDFIYETMVKHRIARRLDEVKKQITKEHKKIADNKTLKDAITANVEQAAEVYSQIDPVAAKALVPKLQTLLGVKFNDFRQLVQQFLRMDDANFMSRYDFFYSDLAPHLVLYRVTVGDVFPVTAYTKTGYATAVNMMVYGTYRFKSFESSPIAGNFNVMDMISFRELYGFMTEERRRETRALEKEMGLADFGRDAVESMFSKSRSLEESQKAAPKAPAKDKKASEAPAGGNRFEQRRNVFNATYSEKEMRDGVFLNAAVMLKDPSKIRDTIRLINEVSKKENLGIQAVDWQEAAGILGQLTFVVRAVLFSCIFVIFLVAAFIITNSMLMATLERSKEIGTMRAIGAQRKMILTMLLQESFLLSFIFGLIGTLIGVVIVVMIGRVGIPASGDVATFFFSGPRLYLTVNPLHILMVLIFMTLIAVLSTQYPAWRAMRISPLEAMRKVD